MADITKCSNQECCKKDTCYRQTAKDDFWQSYMNFKDFCNEETGYANYWEDEFAIALLRNEIKT